LLQITAELGRLKSNQLFSHLSLAICSVQHLAYIMWQETLCTLPSLSQAHAAFCAAAVDSGTKGVRVFQMDHHPRKRIFAEVRIHASVEQVWRVITDYDHLADFVPNLITSKRLPTTTPGRIHLQQLGCSQSVFWRLEAEAVLECVEVHKAMGAKELRFKAIEGDFKVGTVAYLVQGRDSVLFVFGYRMPKKNLSTAVVASPSCSLCPLQDQPRTVMYCLGACPEVAWLYTHGLPLVLHPTAFIIVINDCFPL